MNILTKILVSIGSGVSIGFGLWHFFVPRLWKWYSYFDPSATELIAAVRAINVFFSLSLVLFGTLNILLIFGDNSDRYSIIALLTATSILWLTRVAVQMIYPQGSQYPVLQYAMLAAFMVVLLCYVFSLMIILLQKSSM